MSEVKVNKISPRSGTTVTLGDSGDTFTVPSGATFDASNATTTLPSTVVTTTGTQTLTNKTIDASQLTGTITPSDATVTPAKLDYNYNQYRNIFINGDMSIAQRGTSASSLTSSGYYTVDRFKTSIDNLGTWTQSQSTDVPSGQGFAKSLKMDCTTADASPAAGDSLFLDTKFEGQNLQYLKKGTSSAESLACSFWVKTNKTGTYIVELYDQDNNRSISKSYTVSSADTWEKKTVTFAGDTTGAFDNDNAKSLNVFFWLAGGTNFTSGTLATSWGTLTNANRAVGQVNLADSTANEWYITGVQLEAGTTASDFEFLPYDVNLQRCQRYCQVYGGDQATQSVAVGAASSATGMVATLKPLVKFRATPSASVSAVADFNYLQLSPFTTANLVSFSLVTANSSSDYVNLDLGISGATANSYQIIRTTNINARLTLNAEL